MVNILIADDHALVSRGLKMLLEAQTHFKVVAEANTGQEAIDMAQATHPDVAILDVRMPGISGIEACRQIVTTVEGCKVIMLTAYAEDELLFAAIEAGAAGYVLKLMGGAELVHAIEHISTGEGMIDPAMTMTVFKEMRKIAEVQHAAEFVTLTSQEVAVLRLVMTGMSNQQIGVDLYLAEGTVRNYVSSVLIKLDLPNRAGAAAFATKHHLADLALTH
ncbi:MAG: response regulator transcription factor [Anaerolineae bacterium]|nr:response regulator transcription factor [Anaerolineae bacterium]